MNKSFAIKFSAEALEALAIIQWRIKDARKARQWTQVDLAKATGLQPAAISHFETGQRIPCARNLIKLAKALDVTTDHLLGLNTPF